MPSPGILSVGRLDDFLSTRSPSQRQFSDGPSVHHGQTFILGSVRRQLIASRHSASTNGAVARVDVDDHPNRRDRLDSDPIAVRHLHFLLSRRVEVMASLLFVGAASLVPWTVFLGLSLPGKYDAGHWSLLWTGFDAVLLAVLGYAGWAAWFRRQILATTSIVAGTLLLCDAWFDIVTSIGNSDGWLSLLTGFGIEVPLAVFFLSLYRHIILRTLETMHLRLDDGPPPRRLRDAQILYLCRPDEKAPCQIEPRSLHQSI
jgi:hypothetical protein